jgi:hypothetical protein
MLPFTVYNIFSFPCGTCLNQTLLADLMQVPFFLRLNGLYKLFKQVLEIISFKFPAAESKQVGCGHLAVNGPDTDFYGVPDQCRQCHLRGIGFAAEHGFTEKDPVQAHAVQSSGKFPVRPAFQGVGKTQLMQVDISIFHLLGDPGSFA